jgi:hypothetical protein
VGGITHRKGKEMEEGLQTIDVSDIHDINHVKSIVASLKSALVVANASTETYRARSNQSSESHINDINKISDALLKEADDRDWCSAYDDFVEELNQSLSVELKMREKEYEVDIEVTETRTQMVTVSIKARSEEHAKELVMDSPADYYESELNDYDWEVSDIEEEFHEVREA